MPPKKESYPLDTHLDSSRLATLVSYYAVLLWQLQVGSTIEGTTRVLCSYCMCDSSCYSSVRVPSMVLQLTVATVVLRNMKPMKPVGGNWMFTSGAGRVLLRMLEEIGQCTVLPKTLLRKFRRQTVVHIHNILSLQIEGSCCTSYVFVGYQLCWKDHLVFICHAVCIYVCTDVCM